ncbi:Hypothetical_protein [Hexamita inflata]|uniref:Hypothetical_protein n=1 Tax=Hexamita inflata TaxID=28002 RepID=A0AA86NDZ6_9EUKA|nr:Hypothetical protein HINF_LOCUS4999 [Hexamita inflata]
MFVFLKELLEALNADHVVVVVPSSVVTPEVQALRLLWLNIRKVRGVEAEWDHAHSIFQGDVSLLQILPERIINSRDWELIAPLLQLEIVHESWHQSLIPQKLE